LTNGIHLLGLVKLRGQLLIFGFQCFALGEVNIQAEQLRAKPRSLNHRMAGENCHPRTILPHQNQV
jgi:hypothetical protein